MFNLFRNWRLFRKIAVPMTLVGIIGITALILSAFTLEDSVEALGNTFSTGGSRLRALQETDKLIALYRAMSLKHLSSENARTMEEIAAQVKTVRKKITASLPKIGKLDEQRPEQALLLKQLTGAIALHFTQVERALQLSGDFEKEAGFSLFALAENNHLPIIQGRLQNLTRLTFEDISSSRKNLLAIASRNLYTTIFTGVLAGLLLLGIAFLVTHGASSRLTGLVNWSQQIAAGDLSSRLESEEQDEIGQLTKAMNHMIGHLASNRSALIQAKQQAESVAEKMRMYANAFDRSGEAMLITNNRNRIVRVNASFTEKTGYTLEDVRDKNPSVLASGKTPRETYEIMWESLRSRGFWHGELWDKRKNGEVYPKLISISAIHNENLEVDFYIASFSDITERKANEERIDFLAHHDPLTGLINRYNLGNRLNQALASCSRDNRLTAVMFIDMDRFKTINDTLGHHIGDLLLIEVARRLKSAVRECDIVARLGGDEFVVVVTDMENDMDALPVAEKVQRSLNKTYQVEGNNLHSSPSIGIAVYPADGEDTKTLMKHADTAMYHAKKQGRNNFQFFATDMNHAASERLELENDLRLAIVEEQLELYYQPQLCVPEERRCAFEALVRWHHPKYGMISPIKFIPIAEESGLIEPLGQWVLEEACRQLSQWHSQGEKKLRMAINLSAHQLRSAELVLMISNLLKRHGLQGSDLELEITESTAMENPERAISQLQALRNLGIRLAIDDFGTGYSSLAYLKRLPIQVLKLDRTFVRDIETDPSDAEISAATLALAHSLGLEVVGEGVENEAQRDFLVNHQCDYLQGYLYGRPMPAEEAAKCIADGKQRA
jgi:diguanylate cyclase (GGDEF)-like protein/PAS domain S-box-containing protein